MKFIGTRRELFCDDWLIERLDGLTLQLHQPAPQEVAVTFDEPWEGPVSFYVTVFQDDDRIRMYYRGEGHTGEPLSVTAYAESADGIHWRKPALGLYSFGERRDTNIVWVGQGTQNFAPFKDTKPGIPADERYKALAGGPLLALASPDGIHWRKMREEPVITDGAFDSQNLAFWDEVRGQYVAFIRDFRCGVRTIRRCTSLDFLHWSTPEWVEYGDQPDEHLYTNATVAYYRAPHIYLSFPMRFVPDRKAVPTHQERGISDGVFMSSRDGLHWDRRFLEAFLRPGPDRRNWTDRNNHIAWGFVPTSATASLYWVENYRHPTCRLRKGTIRIDGFTSVNATAAGGSFTTKPLVFTGNELTLNYATSAIGFIQVELLPLQADQQAEPVISEVMYGDEIDGVVRWPDGTDIGKWAGKPVRLRFAMKDADLYSLRFRVGNRSIAFEPTRMRHGVELAGFPASINI